MATYMTELLDRVVALQKEAMKCLDVNADAVPYFWHTQEAFPYFTNRIAATPVNNDGSEDTDLNQPLVIMRLVAAHLTEGYRGQSERKLYEWLPPLKTYFQQRLWLTSRAYPDRMDNLLQVRVTDGGGVRVFQDSGINAMQVGAELQLTCTVPEFIDYEDYL